MSNTVQETEESRLATESVAEDTSSADVAEGGIIGAIGGGIVGAIAGGPIGAVIGAIIGGGASAVAVDAVDHHDRDLENAIAPEPEYPYPPHHPSEPVGLAGEPDGSVFDGSIEPVERTYIIDEIPILEAVAVVVDLEDVIRLRAYELWEERGHLNGLALRDWLDAEKEIAEIDVADTVEYDEEPVIVEEIVIYEA